MKQYLLNDLPSSVYRLQFNKHFTFKSAIKILPYLETLGIDGIYCSPIFESASEHGYDVINPVRLNPLLGTIEDYDEFCSLIKQKGMKQVLDVIPNHMGLKGKNLWWLDVMENGPYSPFSDFFDINWNPVKSAIKNKVLFPILGEPYGKALENQEFTLFWEQGFYLNYDGFQLPIGPHTYANILELLPENAKREVCLDLFQELRADEADEQIDLEKKGEAKKKLAALYQNSSAFRKEIDYVLEQFNGKKGDPNSFDSLHELLEKQYYRLSHWLIAGQEINYRRFFNINELAAICIEKEKVLNSHHRWVFDLIADKKVQGLRIDHPDGLYDPVQYFERIQKKNPSFVVVEKILDFEEQLPASWQVGGTVGYDFLDVLNGIFIQTKNERSFNRIYKNFIGFEFDFHELLYEKKKRFIPLNQASEIHFLASMLEKLTEKNRFYRDITRIDLMRALQEIISCFPVYRTYVKPDEEVKKRDRDYIIHAIGMAKSKAPEIAPIIFQFLHDLLLHEGAYAGEDQKIAAEFLLRFQQLEAPAMAKGLEDSTFYVYNRLISLNEVGGNPKSFGNSKSDFHAFNREKLARWPVGFLASSTHDTKLSEDARMRLHVLSEIPQKWKKIVATWKKQNQKYKTLIKGLSFPEPNLEYYLYQMLLSIWPESEAEAKSPAFLERLWQMTSKIICESDTYTSWRMHNEQYEQAVKDFLFSILTPSEENSFYPSFKQFQKEITLFGKWNSLSSTLLKIGSCGIVDIYQGNDTWNYCGVDPDNRRQVEYGPRKEMLATIIRGENGKLEDKEMKLFITEKALNYRKTHKELFLYGEYIPLQTGKEKGDNVIAFMRKLGDKLVVIAAGRFFTTLLSENVLLPLGEASWGQAEIFLPKTLKEKSFTDILTGKKQSTQMREGKAVFLLAQIFQDFPLAMLVYE